MSQTNTRILLLDDDYESMAPLKLYLETVHGFDVILTAAATITEQLAEERFDLICLDLMIHPVSLDVENKEVKNLHFPDVNWQKTGLAFLEQLRAGVFSERSPTGRHLAYAKERPAIITERMAKHASSQAIGTSPEVPVIILSAVADRSGEEYILQKDQQTVYLEKPFDLEEIIVLIEQLL